MTHEYKEILSLLHEVPTLWRNKLTHEESKKADIKCRCYHCWQSKSKEITSLLIFCFYFSQSRFQFDMKFFILMYEYVISSIIVFNYCFIFVYNQFHVCIVSLLIWSKMSFAYRVILLTTADSESLWSICLETMSNINRNAFFFSTKKLYCS